MVTPDIRFANGTDVPAQENVEFQLRERIKELQAFYALSDLNQRKGISLEALYKEFTYVLPNSWQYPEIAYARLVVDDLTFQTQNAADTPWFQSAEIRVNNEPAGTLEVGYLEYRTEADEGPFLKEERQLIEALAERLGAITEHKRLEAELTRSRAALRALVSRIGQAQEAERARVARDIHDDLGQTLTAIKMDLRWIERATEVPEVTPDIGTIRARATSAIEMVDAMTATVQELAASLRPGVLDHLGVVAAIRVESRRFHARSGIDCRMSLPDTLPEIPAAAAMAIFRIFQECLTNVARHSGATRAGVRLWPTGGDLVLRVYDNGKGIGPDVLDGPGSLGLLGMQERAAVLGGHIVFQQRKKHGTLVTVRVPILLNREESQVQT